MQNEVHAAIERAVHQIRHERDSYRRDPAVLLAKLWSALVQTQEDLEREGHSEFAGRLARILEAIRCA